MATSQAEAPARTTQSWAGASAEPGADILAIQRHFFTVAQDFPRDLMKHITFATCKEESYAY